jgi:hypothetical protein
MGAMKALFDTSILIDYLNGIAEAQTELERYHQRSISLVTWMEVLVGSRDAEDDRILRRFLGAFELAPIDLEVSERSVALRRTHGMRLPDAIIWASAQRQNALLVTRNTRDFPADAPGVRIPYRI